MTGSEGMIEESRKVGNGKSGVRAGERKEGEA